MQLNDVFKADGLLRQKFPQYKIREGQVKMATLVQQAIQSKSCAVVEGATGVGKGFAYLIPLIISGQPGIVSTSNKNLQDQLDKQDLPTLQEVFGRKISWTVLKGKNNYFCTEHFETNRDEIRNELLRNKELDFSETELIIQDIAKWAGKETIGDLEYCPIDLSAKIREMISCDNSTIHEKDSDGAKFCFARQARTRAQSSQIVLVNHTLLAIDIALRKESEGHAGILPKTQIVIMDEAHKFKDAAMLAFSDEITINSLYHLLNWTIVKKSYKPANAKALLNTLRSVLERYLPEKGIKYYQQLKVPKFEGLEPVVAGIEGIISVLNNVGQKSDEKGQTKIKEIIKEAEHLQERLSAMGIEDENMLRWSEAFDNQRGEPIVKLKSTPLDISDLLKFGLFENKTVICTSATLSNWGKFDFFKEQVGMSNDALELVVPSPFNYKEQALVYISDGSQDKAYEIDKLLEFSKGRAFVLFTSYVDMNWAYGMTNTKYPKFKQGQEGLTRAQILEQFKATPNAVLFATASFWEGVDVQGEQLSLVIIYKIPFANPRDLIFSSICEAIDKKAGRKGISFIKYAIPDACLKLKQGAGRLIRSTTDTGVIALLDARVNHARYKDMVIESLPPGYRTQQLNKVESFYAKINKQNT